MTDAFHNFHPQYQQYTQYSASKSYSAQVCCRNPCRILPDFTWSANCSVVTRSRWSRIAFQRPEWSSHHVRRWRIVHQPDDSATSGSTFRPHDRSGERSPVDAQFDYVDVFVRFNFGRCRPSGNRKRPVRSSGSLASDLHGEDDAAEFRRRVPVSGTASLDPLVSGFNTSMSIFRNCRENKETQTKERKKTGTRTLCSATFLVSERWEREEHSQIHTHRHTHKRN